MNRGLVVLEDTDRHRELLSAAADWAAGADADLVLLSLVHEGQFESDVETLETIGSIEDVSYGSGAVLSAAREDLEELADAVVPEGVETTPAAVVYEDGEEAEEILDAAESEECDHVFLVGRRRSPTGKMLFGDVAQQVILNFDGYVTITTA